MALVYRELSPEEFAVMPRDVPGSEIYGPENSRVLAAFNDDGEIVATWTIFACVHIEPIWVRPDMRNSMTILRRMSEAMKDLLRASGIKQVYTVVLDSTPVLHKLARWFGASQVEGALYTWVDKE